MKPIALFCLLVICPHVAAQSAPPRADVHGIKGSLVIVGGGKIPDAVREEFLRLAGGSQTRLVVIPTASAAADKDANKSLEPWKKYPLASLTSFHTRSREKANDPTFIKPLREATAVWFGGGDQSRITDAYLGTAVETELKKLLERDGVIGGTSAGAASMSGIMITGGNPQATTGKGFGFLPNIIVDQHCLKRDREPRLTSVLAKKPGWAGIGIDESTAVIVQGRALRVTGESAAVVMLRASENRPVSRQVLRDAGKADLVALSRAAIERTRPAFPSAKPQVASVPRGTLIIGGGGGMPDEVWTRFIEAAGGPDAPIVFIPTAMPDPISSKYAEMDKLKKAGAKNVKLVHARTPAEAEKPAVINALREAKGIWFTGGRQWRLVDAYLDTTAEKEMHGVLARGGVIGGSSAGASIQADYMVRGDPLGNTKMIAEGYERGLGFLKGVAIDQHFFKRKRVEDMSAFMNVFPQLLGIGIDENTALVVRGEEMEIIGKSIVGVFDRRKPRGLGQLDFEIFQPGSRYNLKSRQRVDVSPGPLLKGGSERDGAEVQRSDLQSVSYLSDRFGKVGIDEALPGRFVPTDSFWNRDRFEQHQLICRRDHRHAYR